MDVVKVNELNANLSVAPIESWGQMLSVFVPKYEVVTFKFYLLFSWYKDVKDNCWVVFCGFKFILFFNEKESKLKFCLESEFIFCLASTAQNCPGFSKANWTSTGQMSPVQTDCSSVSSLIENSIPPTWSLNIYHSYLDT